MVNKRKKKEKRIIKILESINSLLRSDAQLQPSSSTIVNKSQLISQLPTSPTPLNSPFPQEGSYDSQILTLEPNPPDLPQIQQFS